MSRMRLRTRRWAWASVIACALWPAGTCSSAEQGSFPRSAYLLHLNGVGGRQLWDEAMIEGLRQGGFPGQMEIYDWTGGNTGMEALLNRSRHRAETRTIAHKILQLARAQPDRPIFLTSHSAGCGLAVWALESLPDDVRIEALVMFAPALSPDYDLTRALRHVKNRAYVFSSPYDRVVLEIGTKLFGTVDGKKVPAAGLCGFVQPASADPEQYRKLSHRPYKAEWLKKYGNFGSHVCPLGTRFAREYVASLLLSGSAPDDPGPGTQESLPGSHSP